MVSYLWAETYRRVVAGSVSQDWFLDEVVRSLAQPSWRQRNAQNLVEIEQIRESLIHLRNRAVGNDRDFALLQVLVMDVDRYKHLIELFYNKRIIQEALIEQLDHLSDKIRREVLGYRKSSSSPPPPIVVRPRTVTSPTQKARVEITSGGKRISKVLEEGHVTINGKEYGAVRGGNFLAMAKGNVFVVEPLDKIGTLIVKGASKTMGGDYLLNSNQDYDCEVSSLTIKLRIVV